VNYVDFKMHGATTKIANILFQLYTRTYLTEFVVFVCLFI